MVLWLGYCCYLPLLRFLIYHTSTTAEHTSQRSSIRLRAFRHPTIVSVASKHDQRCRSRRPSKCLWDSSMNDDGGGESRSPYTIPHSKRMLIALGDFSEVSAPEYGKVLSSLFEKELHLIRGRDIAEAMFLAVKVWKDDRSTDINRRNLGAIAARLQQFPVDCWRCKDIAFKLYAMQSVRSDDVGAIEFINVIVEIVENSVGAIRISDGTKFISQFQMLSLKDLAMMMYGLQGFRSDCEGVCRLLTVLTSKIPEATGTLDAAGVGQCLFGLQSMSSNRAEVRALLSVLTRHIEQSDSTLDAQAVSNSLYGLQLMSSDHVEVRTLLTVLSSKVEICTVIMSALEVRNCLSGLKMMKSDHAEVRTLLQVLVARVLGCEEGFTGVMLCDMLYGLQGMSTHHSESVTLLSSLLTGYVKKVSNLEHQYQPSPLPLPLTALALSRALYGLQRADTSHLIVRQIVELLTRLLTDSPDVFTADNIGMALYGMQHMSSECVETRNLLTIMQVKIMKCRAHPESLDKKKRKYMKFSKKDLPRMRSTAITNALYGLQNMSSTYGEVRQTLFLLTPLLRSCGDEFSSKELTNALYGLQGMGSEHREVVRILGALQGRILASRAMMSPEELGRALYGLRSMSCAQREVADIVGCFVPKMQACDEMFTSRSVANALNGLQHMSSDCPSMRDLLSALAPKIQSCTEPFSAEDVCRMLHSLGGMSADHTEVRTLLLVLVLKIKNCPDPFTAIMASRAINGLQGMSIEYFEVRTLLFALIPKVKNIPDYFTARDVATALFGMHQLFGKIESQSLVDYLFTQVKRLSSLHNGKEFNMLDTEDIVQLHIQISFALSNPTFAYMSTDRYDQWHVVNTQLQRVISQRAEDAHTKRFHLQVDREKDEETETDAVPSVDCRERVLLVIQAAYNSTSVYILHDTLLLNMFQGDIVLQVAFRAKRKGSMVTKPDTLALIGENKEQITDFITINVQIEEEHSSRNENPRYTVLRDNYLKSRGVFVVRIRSTDVMKAETHQLSDWVIRMIDAVRERRKVESSAPRAARRLHDDFS